MVQRSLTSRSGWTLATRTGSGFSSKARTVRMAGPYVSITIMIPSTPFVRSSLVIASTSSRLRAGRRNTTSATDERIQPAPWHSWLGGR